MKKILLMMLMFAPIATFAQKFGHINAQEVMTQMPEFTTKLVNAIKAVGKAGGYVYIMDVSSGIPYISDTLSKDVTAEVKAQLNKLK